MSMPPPSYRLKWTPQSWVRVGFIIALFIYGVIGAWHYEAFDFIHGVNLLIHEFGHMFFGLFGNETLYVMGGTLAQMIMPALFAGYFFRAKQYYSTAAVLFWVGQNFLDVAVYMRDARALQLPLVGVGGGGETIHDWNYLFDQWHVLVYDIRIADVVAGIGILVLLASLVLGLYFAAERVAIPPPDPGEERPKREIVCHDYLAPR